MRAAILARVSTGEQATDDRHSLPEQLRAIRERCRREGWDVVATFEAPEESASVRSIVKRPKLRELVEAARRREFDLVLFHESSRLARDEELAQWLINELQEVGVRLVESDRPADFFYTVDGRFMYGLNSGLNAWQRRNHGEQVAKGKQGRFERGLHTGDLPFGYVMQLRESPDGTRTVATDLPAAPDETEASAIRLAFEDTAAGVSQLEICERWNAVGLRPHSKQGATYFTPSGIASILENDFYCGYIHHKGERRRGAHEPILTEELWLAVQMRKRRSTRSTRARSPRLLSGLARCSECGGPIWLTAPTGADGRTRAYYRETSRARASNCVNAGTLWRADEADQLVGSVVRTMSADADWIASIDRDARRLEADSCVESQRDELKEERRRLGLAFMAKVFDEREFHRLAAALDARIARLPTALRTSVLLMSTKLRNVGQVWDVLNDDERRTSCRLLFEKVQIDTRAKMLWLKPWPEAEELFAMRRRYVLSLAPPAGFEPAARRLEGVCSIP
jgi:DNA invertase Pin-like site-specific DNA recombinase